MSGGWTTLASATVFFRRLWERALAAGVQPGQPLREGTTHLRWLVEGHPDYPTMSAEGISHFTIEPDGRGNHRFVLVDMLGAQHAFSTRAALTGRVRPLRRPADPSKPFKGLAP
jgi:hypothetical protein